MEQSLNSNARISDYEIVFDSDEYSLYKIYKKYEQLSEKIEERLERIKSKKLTKNK